MALLNSPTELLARNLRLAPDAVAFIDGERVITYARFDGMCRRTAAWLTARGIRPGDKVAVWLVNRVEWLALYFALARIGAALVAVNTRYRSHEVEYILERSGARMLVLELNFRSIDFPAVLAKVNAQAAVALEQVAVLNPGEGAVPDTVLGKSACTFDLALLPDEDATVTGTPDSLSILFTTSGTTSGPKLVMHSQRTVVLHSQRVAAGYGFEAEGVCLLGVLPLCGVFGFDGVLGAFAAGKPVVLMEAFDARTAAGLIARHQITHLFGSDEMFRRLLDEVEGERPFPSLRVCGYAWFQPWAEDIGRQAWRRGVPLVGLYGSSEVHALFSLQRPQLDDSERVKGGGLPCNPTAQIRIRDIDTGELLPADRPGAIEIRADSNFVGYLNNPQATHAAIDAEGFFATGDVGYLRQDGSFVYQMRQGDAMRLGGFLVSPAEIEDVLKEQPGVQDCQVVGVDIDDQVRCAAFVILDAGAVLDEAALKAAAASVLAAFKVPARIWAVESFPRTQSANGDKIQRAKLREMATQRLDEA